MKKYYFIIEKSNIKQSYNLKFKIVIKWKHSLMSIWMNKKNKKF